KVVVGVEEKAQPRTEVVHIEAASARPLHVLHAVVKGECQFLQRGRAGLADVISADRNRVEAWREFRTKLESVHYQAHRGRWGVDVLLLGNVFLQNIVLNRTGNLLPVGALLFRDHQVHRPQHRRRRIDSHRYGCLFQVNARFTTISGVPIGRLYTEADLPEDWSYDQYLGYPGKPPYTRGIHATGYRGKLF